MKLPDRKTPVLLTVLALFAGCTKVAPPSAAALPAGDPNHFTVRLHAVTFDQTPGNPLPPLRPLGQLDSSETLQTLTRELNLVYSQIGLTFDVTLPTHHHYSDSRDYWPVTDDRAVLERALPPDLFLRPDGPMGEGWDVLMRMESVSQKLFRPIMNTELDELDSGQVIHVFVGENEPFWIEKSSWTAVRFKHETLRRLFAGEHKGLPDFCQSYAIWYVFGRDSCFESQSCYEANVPPGPGTYVNTLGHEIGHYFGLTHDPSRVGHLMAQDSNRLFADQIEKVRKTIDERRRLTPKERCGSP